jgi:hypothetical protein
MATPAGLGLGQSFKRLHLHQSGAEDGEKKPREAFHEIKRRGKCALRNYYSSKVHIW